MRHAPAHLLVLLAAAVCLAACGRGRVIPEHKMTQIFMEMFLADTWLRDNPEARKVADTTLFFDPIFRRHGYPFKAYDLSIHYYLDRPDRFGKILTATSAGLEAEFERLQEIIDAERIHQEALDRYRRVYHPHDFSKDSLRWAEPRILWPVTDSVAASATRKKHLFN